MSILSRLFRRDAPMNPASLYNLIDGGSPFAGTGGGYGDGYGPGNGAPWNVNRSPRPKPVSARSAAA